MKKLVLIAGAAFVAAAGAGTAGRLIIKPPIDSRTRAETAGDPASGTAQDAARTGSALASIAAALPAPAGDAAPGAWPRAVAAPTVTAGDSSHESPRVEFFEMTRILAGLPPADAAIFVEQLDDGHAVALLRSMTVNDAAAILANMQDKRRQVLKERLLESPRAGR